jgi:hypothetical protein
LHRLAQRAPGSVTTTIDTAYVNIGIARFNAIPIDNAAGGTDLVADWGD